jgi:hypothetical protein
MQEYVDTKKYFAILGLAVLCWTGRNESLYYESCAVYSRLDSNSKPMVLWRIHSILFGDMR